MSKQVSFDDLDFQEHSMNESKEMVLRYGPAVHARMHFHNGYGVSVIRGRAFYSDGDDYEVAMLDKDGRLMYTDIVNNDVLGHLTKDQVTDVMRKIAAY
jgi:hypothetical protein